ncbi:WhiB family transcriptional regulator [Streptosporangium carneum]|uniref:Transcriptional regulator WhiB n=1 Tax=Streptosporangium carneum TaxID=47481 RepID=A0A9W6MAR7_9ACTN|nr:WhiB family transcriptional regulator [Streptosporangium carneum]GLK07272.1 hypothetical protein GCM10017600_06770 [Streptosporangium carneum]
MRQRDRYGAWGLDSPRGKTWQDRAACVGADPEIFYPKVSTARKQEGAERRAYDKAKKVCARCTVRQECGEYALARDDRYGMWGGLTPRQRRILLNQRMKAAG